MINNRRLTGNWKIKKYFGRKSLFVEIYYKNNHGFCMKKFIRANDSMKKLLKEFQKETPLLFQNNNLLSSQNKIIKSIESII